MLTHQVLGCLFYAYYVFVRLCIPQFRSIRLQLFDLKAMVLGVFNSILPGKICFKPSHKLDYYFFIHEMRCVIAVLKAMFDCFFFFKGVLVLFLGFFAFLHCWLNAFAEMLRFADRMFYKVL